VITDHFLGCPEETRVQAPGRIASPVRATHRETGEVHELSLVAPPVAVGELALGPDCAKRPA
jgi:hypothetical protein